MTSPTRRRGVAQASKTPIRAGLKADSPLQPMVKNGLAAVTKQQHDYFDENVRSLFSDSLDVDEALKEGREQENRWDYLVGHEPSRQIVGVEPHTAKNSEITTLIKKLEAARHQLQGHLRHGARVSKWLWVASGTVHFAPMEKATLRLAQNGITFVGKKITQKHLR